MNKDTNERDVKGSGFSLFIYLLIIQKYITGKEPMDI
jgi:hypothetical protein